MSQKRTTPLESPSIKKHHCTVDVRMEKLGMIPFFQSLDREALQQVNEKFSASHFSAGHSIYEEGDIATLLRVVVYGAVKLSRFTKDGKEILVDMLKPGEYFGSLNELGEDRYSETATAQSDVCILSIGNREFRSVLNTNSSIAVSILDITTKKLTSAREQIHHLTTLSVEKRIAHILLKLCEKFGEKKTVGILLQLPLSRKDLADMTGTSTETASRIMSRFQQEEMITSGRLWVAINDKDALSAVISGT
ncbi:Crp/Fnr family transcriptional regulator [Rhodohalobacter sp. SW132]|uniref:Crp/Fnr family transcriptional regulator n=1 Tax=Rhodohalobacter sp. SW132 TaxID=2293433 RepID=UPI000E22B0B1|nr:Crp/Fnr family transcriptional regulator [Rhodohalobacter sp. SW132]REL38599.1 Crp/Fnr family transcriptional regulator [Rhodohalobacter sp. SW132]